MVALNGFDATQVAPSEPRESLPPGNYEVMIVASKQVDTKAGTGWYIELEMDVIAGQFQGRKVWDRLNLVNPNQQAVEIAQRTLSSICHAVGVLQPQDTEQLHHKPMMLTMKAKADKQNPGQMRVEPAGYAPKAAAQPGNGWQPPRQQAPAPQPQMPPPPAMPSAPQTMQPPANSTGTPPWRR